MSGNYSARHRALNSNYSLWPTASDGCAYCGVVADTYDHVPPLSVVHALGVEHFEERHIRLYLVPCCRECNSLLGACPATTVTARRPVLKTRLRKRYAKFLDAPDWSPAELDELGYNLRAVIESAGNIKDWVRRRLAW